MTLEGVSRSAFDFDDKLSFEKFGYRRRRQGTSFAGTRATLKQTFTVLLQFRKFDENYSENSNYNTLNERLVITWRLD